MVKQMPLTSVWLRLMFVFRSGATSAFEETGRMHPLVIWTGHCAAFREHCQAGAELLHSHGSPEWRQVGRLGQLGLRKMILNVTYCGHTR